MAEQIEMPFGFWTRVGLMKRRRCGFVSDYFDQLSILLLFGWFSVLWRTLGTFVSYRIESYSGEVAPLLLSSVFFAVFRDYQV